jgi:hypothetical protein
VPGLVEWLGPWIEVASQEGMRPYLLEGGSLVRLLQQQPPQEVTRLGP